MLTAGGFLVKGDPLYRSLLQDTGWCYVLYLPKMFRISSGGYPVSVIVILHDTSFNVHPLQIFVGTVEASSEDSLHRGT